MMLVLCCVVRVRLCGCAIAAAVWTVPFTSTPCNCDCARAGDDSESAVTALAF